ncbi:MAG: hypothetical protein ACK5FT_08370 [Sphingomonadales bacterium]|jgi:ActR/RegA family two-component response regulator
MKIRKFEWNKKYSLNDLREFINKKQNEMQRNLSKTCRILIIDDDLSEEENNYVFDSQLKYLKNQLGFDITTKDDLYNMRDAAGYDIIICDIDGVGLKLGGNNGIWLLNEINKEYPDKILVLYTNYNQEIRKLNRIENATFEKWDKGELIDNYIKNGQDGFADKIKTTMNYFADPARRWQKLRNKMLGTEMSIHEVAMLESYFVKSIVKNDKNIFDKMLSKYNNKHQNDIDFKSLLFTSKSIIETTLTLISLL